MQLCVKSALHRHCAQRLGSNFAQQQNRRSSLKAMADEQMQLAVCGLHMRGQKLEHQLTDLGATFLRSCRSSPVYELYAVTDPANSICKPGMVAVGNDKGRAIELEVWNLPVQHLGRFFLQISEPLGLGTVSLEDGSNVKGFICEGYVANPEFQPGGSKSRKFLIENITKYASWKQYKAQQH